MLVTSIIATVLLSIVGLLALIIIPQVETRGQMRMAFGLLLIQVFAIVTIWVLYGQI
jgi:hypothetical protein